MSHEPDDPRTSDADEPLGVDDALPDVEALLCDGEVFRPRALEETVGDRGLLLSFHGFSFSAIATNWWKRYERYGWSDIEGVPLVCVCRDGPYAVNEFVRQVDASFDVYADVDAEIADAFGLRRSRDDMPDASTARRAVYVFDDAGRATYRWLSDDDVSPVDVDGVEEVVSSL